MYWNSHQSLDGFLDSHEEEGIERTPRLAINQLLQYEGLLKRARAGDRKLIAILSRPEHLSVLLGYAVGIGVIEKEGPLEEWIVAGGEEKDQKEQKDDDHFDQERDQKEHFDQERDDPMEEFDERLVRFPFMASELLSLDCPPILEALERMGPEALRPFWSFLSAAAPSPLPQDLSVYFGKILSSWLSRKPSMILSFLQAFHPSAVDALIGRTEVGAIVEVLYKILSAWIIKEGRLAERLLDKLGPQHCFQVQQSVLQFLGGLFVLQSPTTAELLRDLLDPPLIDRTLSQILCSPYPAPPPSRLQALLAYGVGVEVLGEIVRMAQGMKLAGLLVPLDHILAQRIPVLARLLTDDPSSYHQLPSGRVPRVTADRLRTVRLLTILQSLHSQAVDAAMLENQIPRILVALFFGHPANNLLHGQVLEYLERLLDDQMDICNPLVMSLFQEGRLLEHILAAQRANDAAVSRPFGSRLGYMGHLTLLVDRLEAYRERLEACRDRLDANNLSMRIFGSAEWKEYLGGSYGQAKSIQSHILGSTTSTDQQTTTTPISKKQTTAATLASFTAAFPSSADEQIARYFCQQVISNVPPTFAYNLAAELEESDDDIDFKFSDDDDDDDVEEAGERYPHVKRQDFNDDDNVIYALSEEDKRHISSLLVPPGISVPLTLAGPFDNILEMEMRMASLNEQNDFYRDDDYYGTDDDEQEEDAIFSDDSNNLFDDGRILIEFSNDNDNDSSEGE